MPGKRGLDEQENDEEKKERKLYHDGFAGAVAEW
jgi:hypothetical protein